MLAKVRFRFYEELNDHLPAERRKATFTHPVEAGAAVGEVIKAMGVPLSEVEMIRVDGKSVDFSHRLYDGARASVYPVFESFNITPEPRVRQRPLRQIRFVLDVDLGRLATYLRMFGFDTLYRNDCDSNKLIEISRRDRRILCTRDRKLLTCGGIERGYRVREMRPRRQLVEVLRRFDLLGSVTPLCRCLRCNAMLVPLSPESVLARRPIEARRHDKRIWVCPDCQRISRRGSHYRRMRSFMQQIRRQGREGSAGMEAT